MYIIVGFIDSAAPQVGGCYTHVLSYFDKYVWCIERLEQADWSYVQPPASCGSYLFGVPIREILQAQVTSNADLKGSL